MNDHPTIPPLQSFDEFEAATVSELGPGAAKPTVGARHRKGNGGAPPLKRIDVTMGSDITPEPISFAWAGWLAYGKLHINAGRPGSHENDDGDGLGGHLHERRTMAGRISCGARPSSHIWSGEDAIDDTLLPRFMAAGGDRDEIGFISGVEENGEKRPFDPRSGYRRTRRYLRPSRKG